HQDLAERFVQPGRMDGLLQVHLHFVFVARIRVDHVPLLRHDSFPAGAPRSWAVFLFYRNTLNSEPIPKVSSRSTTPMKSETITASTITPPVGPRTSWRVAQLTLVAPPSTSLRTSRASASTDISFRLAPPRDLAHPPHGRPGGI